MMTAGEAVTRHFMFAGSPKAESVTTPPAHFIVDTDVFR